MQMGSMPAERPPFRRIAVLGLGLMGGSFARALAACASAPTVVGWSRDKRERDAAREAGALAEAPAEWETAVEGADLVMLAMPLTATCATIAELPGHIGDGATVSDMASLKVRVAQSVHAAALTSRWVGSHPMAGGVESGFEASSQDLFRGARVWMTYDESAAEKARRVNDLWARLGATPAPIEVEEHDRVMALVSHLPQVTANALALALLESGVELDQLGPGGLGMTRLAASNPSMWRDLLENAPPELGHALRRLAATLVDLADNLEGGGGPGDVGLDDLTRLMERTGAWRTGA